MGTLRRVRRAVTLPAAVVLLAGPTALAFFAGGFFDEPRLIAALVTWALVLVAALASPAPLPRSLPGRLAVAGMALIFVWTAVSLAWAPLLAPATDSLVRVLLYLAALVAAAALLRGRAQLRAVEPVLALGAVVVIGYGLSGRLLPGLIELSRSQDTGGRLEQPITYWNAEAAIAAMGLILCMRLMGDRSRPTAVRVLAAAATAPLGAGLYLTLSRGAMAAAVVGLAVLLAVAPTRSQLRAIAVALVTGVAAAGTSAAFSGFASFHGSLADQKREGAIMLAILVVLVLAAGLSWAWASRAERRGRLKTGRLAIAPRLPAVARAVLAVTLIGLVVGGLGERGEAELRKGAGQAGRLTTLKSTRYEYWRVGLRTFAENPLQGVGAAGFRVEWLRERPVRKKALDVHSLPLEMASELGIIGLAGLGMLFAGAGLAARRALGGEEPLLAGAAAATMVFAVHATIDWDWQFPAVTLPALVMAGALIAASEGSTAGDGSPASGPAARGRETAVA